MVVNQQQSQNQIRLLVIVLYGLLFCFYTVFFFQSPQSQISSFQQVVNTKFMDYWQVEAKNATIPQKTSVFGMYPVFCSFAKNNALQWNTAANKAHWFSFLKNRVTGT